MENLWKTRKLEKKNSTVVSCMHRGKKLQKQIGLVVVDLGIKRGER